MVDVEETREPTHHEPAIVVTTVPEMPIGDSQSSTASLIKPIGALSRSKRELLPTIASQTNEWYRLDEMDVRLVETQDVASLMLQLGAVDVADMLSSARFTRKCN